MCSLRDVATTFEELRVKVYGCSLDSVGDQKKFHLGQELNFPLLSDPDGSVAAKFEVLSKRGPFSARVTFVIDSKGVVRHIDDGVNVDSHGQDLIEVIERLP